jgi:hypothetical protein
MIDTMRKVTARRIARPAVVAILALTITGAAIPAGAVTRSNTGSVGSVYYQRTAGYSANMSQSLNSGQITAYRSPASTGTQQITIRWRVWEYQGGQWYVDGTGQSTYTVQPGQYVGINGWTHTTTSGLYATDLTVTWRTTTGVQLGRSFIDYVHSGDYECWTPYPSCSLYQFGGQYGLALF